MQNVEIEIKLKLDDPATFMVWLENNAELIKESKQKDDYFDPPHKSFVHIDEDGYKHADEWFRIRMSDKGNEVNYKHWHRDPLTGGSTYADEFETEIVDAQIFREILDKLGFKQNSCIEKSRRSFRYGDFQFDCDEVKNMGFFVEIEFKGEAENPMAGKEKIFSLLQEIGLTNYKKTLRGYHYMLWNPDKEHYES